MRLFKVKNEEKYGVSPTKMIYGIQFTNGYGMVEKYYDWRFFQTKEEDFEDVTPEAFKGIHNEAKKILIRIPGGIGDTLFVTPMIEGIKKKYGSDCQIVVMGLPQALPVLYHNPDIHGFIEEPQLYIDKLMEEYDDMYEIGCTIENNPEAELENAYKLTSDYFELDPKSYNPMCWITPEEIKKAKHTLASIGVPLGTVKIGVHLDSTSPLRGFPKAKMNTLLNKLSELGKVFLFSTNGNNMHRSDFACTNCGEIESACLHPDVEKLTLACRKCGAENEVARNPDNPNVHHIVGTKLRDSMALIAEMNLMVCVDSGLLHLAQALDVPAIALFSNYDADLRTRYFKNTISMNTTFRCAPCHLNNTNMCPPMLKAGLQEPPCIQEYNIDGIFNAAKYIVEAKGVDFPSVHLNPPPPPRMDRKQCILCGNGDFDIICRKKDVLHAKCLLCESIFALSESPKDCYAEPEYHLTFDDAAHCERMMRTSALYAKDLNEMIGSKGNKILEIGCNRGNTLRGFASEGWIPYGIEYSQDAIDRIPEDWKDNIIKGDFFDIMEKNVKNPWLWPGPSNIKRIKDENGNVTETWLRPNFDCVWLQHTFEHFDKPLEAFRKLITLVKPEGFLVITGPSASAMNKWGTGKHMHLNTYAPGEHQIIPSKKAMIKLAHDHELDIVDYKEEKTTGNMVIICRKRK